MVEAAPAVSDHEIHIKYEDQEKINQFARYHSKMLEIKVGVGYGVRVRLVTDRVSQANYNLVISD